MLKAGVMEDGIVHKTTEGTPQGGVISPLLANLIGDIIGKELEKSGYKFVRYADDFVVMTKTKEELPAALSCVKEIIEEKLAMKLSEDKTKLTSFKRGFRFLGYNKYKGISTKSLDKLKDNIRDITKRTQGVNLQAVIDILNPVIRGHVNYFRLGNVQKVYCLLDCWVRRRLRYFKFSRKWRTEISISSSCLLPTQTSTRFSSLHDMSLTALPTQSSGTSLVVFASSAPSQEAYGLCTSYAYISCTAPATAAILPTEIPSVSSSPSHDASST